MVTESRRRYYIKWPNDYAGLTMAWLLFIDESGQDHRDSPYEVLAGVAVRDCDVGPIIQELHAIEIRNFGRRYSSRSHELKGKKILKTKVFSHSQLNVDVPRDQIWSLAKRALDDGASATPQHWKALAMAKINYVSDVFDLCNRYDCKVFASVVETDAPASAGGGLRKDYAYLFERFFYFLEDFANLTGVQEQGIIVFDELDKARSHILIEQAYTYFKETATGRHRAGLIVPEPFFVHSDLTTGIQLADLAAYCLSWGFRTSRMTKPKRDELDEFARQIARMRHRSYRERHGRPDFEIWSIAHIRDLRTNMERFAEDAMED